MIPNPRTILGLSNSKVLRKNISSRISGGRLEILLVSGLRLLISASSGWSFWNLRLCDCVEGFDEGADSEVGGSDEGD